MASQSMSTCCICEGISDDDIRAFFFNVCIHSIHLFSVFDETRYGLRPAELFQVFAPVGDHHVDVGIVLDRQLQCSSLIQEK